MLEKDGLIKTNIKKEAAARINFCREETKNYSKFSKEITRGCSIVWRENRKFNQRVYSAIFKYVWAI